MTVAHFSQSQFLLWMLVSFAAFRCSFTREGEVFKIDCRAFLEGYEVVFDLPGLAPVSCHEEDSISGHDVPMHVVAVSCDLSKVSCDISTGIM